MIDMETENQQGAPPETGQAQEPILPAGNNTDSTQPPSLAQKVNKPLFFGVLAILGIVAFFFLGSNTEKKEKKPKAIPKPQTHAPKQVEIEQLPEIIINEESNIIEDTEEIEEPTPPPPPPPPPPRR